MMYAIRSYYDAVVLVALAFTRLTEDRPPGEVHLIALNRAAAVQVEDVALLECAIGSGGAQACRRAGIEIGAAFVVVLQDLGLHLANGDAGLQLLEGPLSYNFV